MILHNAGETIFELSELVGVLDTDTYAVAREKLTHQLRGGETLDQFHARLLQLSKNCNFANREMVRLGHKLSRNARWQKSGLRARVKLT